jgi:hypothetical protein
VPWRASPATRSRRIFDFAGMRELMKVKKIIGLLF